MRLSYRYLRERRDLDNEEIAELLRVGLLVPGADVGYFFTSRSPSKFPKRYRDMWFKDGTSKEE